MNKHFVKAAPVWLIRRFIAQVPFAEDASSISRVLQHLRQRDGIGRQSFALEDRMRDAIPELVTSREQRRARGRASGTHIEVCESNALTVELIQVWRPEHRIPVAAQVAVTLIVGDDEDDIGTFGAVG
jgi:hypothetical protein